MSRKTGVLSGVVALLLGYGNTILAENCPKGTVLVEVFGSGRANQVRDVFNDQIFKAGLSTFYPIATLGTMTLKSRREGLSLHCGIRGVMVSADTGTYPAITAKFDNYVVCSDHSEFRFMSDATTVVDPAERCSESDYPLYAPPDQPPNKGAFSERGNVVGVWGIFAGATGSLHTIRGSVNCGLLDFDYRAALCLKRPLRQGPRN